MLTVAVFKWRPTLEYAHAFSAAHVNAMCAAVARHYPHPHRFICITDDDADVECETFPLWDTWAEVPNPTGGGRPSCYRRLRMFDPEISSQLGDRIVWLDLDMLIIGDVSGLWNRPEPFVGLKDAYIDAQVPGHINGSMVLFDPRDEKNISIWRDFDPSSSPALAAAKGNRGSDQAWMSYKMSPCPRWTGGDGVLRFGKDFSRFSEAPPDCRIVSFAGPSKPWYHDVIRVSPWIRDALPEYVPTERAVIRRDPRRPRNRYAR